MSKTSNLTYLVTGAAGFIGASFVRSCQKRNISLISVDRPEFFRTREEMGDLNFGKIVDIDELPPLLLSGSLHLDGIVHLGAITDTRASDLALLEKMNVEYSKTLWNYSVKNKVPFVYASSAATYGDGNLGYKDDESQMQNLQPLNPYGESKRKFDLWALDQEKKGSTPPAWSGFKFFNVYGYGERHKGFMSSVVLHSFDQVQKAGKVTLFKSHRDGIPDGFQKRDFVSVEDVVQVLHFALEKPIARGIFNLGSGEARPFLDLAKAVFSALNKPAKINFVDTPLSIRDKYQYFTEADMSKLEAEGYTQKFLSLEDGVKNYIHRLTK